MSPRVEVNLSAGYSSGTLGLDEAAETLTYSGLAGIRYGVSRTVAISLDYQYYQYDFAEAARLPEGLPFADSRQSVRAGITLLLPLVR